MSSRRWLAPALFAFALSLPARPQVPPPPGGATSLADALFIDGNGGTWYGELFDDGSLQIEAVSTAGDPMTEGSITVTDTSITCFGTVNGDAATELMFTGTAPDGSTVSASFTPDGNSILTDSTGTKNELPPSELGL
jgi:hypothetical protein